MMKAYLDNVICSGIARCELDPPAEMNATRALLSARDHGVLILVTSAESWREQEKTVDPQMRATLAKGREPVPRVAHDYTVLGFNFSTDQLGGFRNDPLITDIVDDLLFRQLRIGVGLAEADARHVMYAVYNGCCRFVTLDTNDLLPKKAQVEAVCTRLKLVTPTELASELGLPSIATLQRLAKALGVPVTELLT